MDNQKEKLVNDKLTIIINKLDEMIEIMKDKPKYKKVKQVNEELLIKETKSLMVNLND